MIVKRPISTFKEVLPSTPKSTTHIILVHGLENKRTKALRRDLKAWLRDLGERTKCRVSVLGFDASELLIKGRQRFTLLADHLCRDVKGLEGDRDLVFIGHEIAGWVISEALARYTSDQMALHTRSVIFCGLPECYNAKQWNEYAGRFLEIYSKNLRCALDFHFLQVVQKNFEQLKQSGYGPKSNVLYLTKLVQSSEKPGPLPVDNVPRRTTESSESSASTTSSLPEISTKVFFEIKKGDENDEKVSNLLTEVVSGDQRLQPSTSIASRPGTGRNVVFTSQSPPKLDLEIQRLATNISASEATFSIPEGLHQRIYDVPSDVYNPTKFSHEVGHFGEPASSAPDTLRSSDYNALEEMPSEHYKELLRVATLYQQRGELNKSNAIYTQLIEDFESAKLATSSEGIGYIKCQRAITWLYEGKFKEAEAAFLELEKSRCDIFQEHALLCEHERTWEVSRLLAVTFDMRGRYADALKKLKQLEEDVKVYPSEKTDDIRFLAGSTHALVLGHMGEYEDADKKSLECCNRAEQIMDRRMMKKDDHGRAVDKYGKDAAFWAKKLGTIQSNRAAVLIDAGIYKGADEINEKALRNMEKCFGSKHVVTLDCWSLKARLLASKSKLDEAETLCQQTLTGMRREIGKEHPSTMRTLGIMVFIYKCQARLRDALDTARHLLDMNRASHAFGHKHPETIKSLYLLADIYVARGDLSNALSAQRETKKLAEEVLGQNHPTTLAYTSYLGYIYCKLGSTSVASDIFCSVFVHQFGAFAPPELKKDIINKPIDEKTLWEILGLLRRKKIASEKVHLPILATMQCLGVLGREQHNGNLDLAREFHDVSFDLRKERLGAGHADTLSSQWELAITDRQLGYHTAKNGFETVVLARKALLGEEHPDTLSARHELSVTNWQLGFIESAAEEQAEVLRLRRLLLGDRHPDTIHSCVDLSHVYYSLGKLKEAEALLLEGLSAQVALYQHPQLPSPDLETYLAALKVLDLAPPVERAASKEFGQFSTKKNTCHPKVIASLATLASIYAITSDFTRAEILQLAVVSQQNLLLGPEDPTTLEALDRLGQIYQTKGEFNKAIKIYEEIEKLAPEGSLVQFNSQSNLGSLYFNMQDFTAAERIQSKVYQMLQNASWSASQEKDAFVLSTYNLALTKMELALATSEAATQAEAINLIEKAFHAARLTWKDSDPRTIMILETLENWKCDEPQLNDRLLPPGREVTPVA